jgi:type IV secretion system protein VirB9
MRQTRLCVARAALWFVSVIVGATCRAEALAERTKLDSRIQVVRHTGDIVRVLAAEGVATTIEFDRSETIKDFAMGDRDAWKAKHNGNLFIFKPHMPKGDTNLTVFTDKRAYLFRLVMLRKETPSVAYWLKVEAPPPPTPAPPLSSNGAPVVSPEAMALAKRELEQRQIAEDFKQTKFQGRLNYDYWIVGPTQLQPIAAHDNGTFTYLTFSASNPLPAPFVMEPDGTEALVDFHMDPDGMTMVLHRVVERIVVRRGDLVAGITNRAVNRPAQPSPTGTTSDRVRRVIPLEGAQQ